MTTVTATEARANFYRMIDDVADSHQPITITSQAQAMLF